jgi:hypothetical protein
VVIKRWNKEFAFGGHNTPGVSGVYSTPPRQEPAGAIFRQEVFQGVTFKTDDELFSILDEAKQIFQGTTYDLLKCNCHSFTSFLCFKLTNKPPPAWLNRAASIAFALRPVIPRAWIATPDWASLNGELLHDNDGTDGRASLPQQSDQPFISPEHVEGKVNDERQGKHRKKTIWSRFKQKSKGRTPPASEHAPMPTGH